MRNDVQTAVTIRGERKARLNVVGGEVRKIVQYLGNGHTAAEIVENVGYRDARAANARLAAADTRVDGDPLTVIHGKKVGFGRFRVKEGPEVGSVSV